MLMRLYSNFLISLLVLTFIDGASQQIKVQSSTRQNNTAFGYSVSQCDNYLIVGAKDEKVNETKSGAAYIYQFENDDWIKKAKLLPENAADGEFYGISVSIVGSYAVVGASGDDTNDTNNGAAYIYELENEDWIEKVKLLPEEVSREDKFGRSVSTDGQKVIIGSVLSDEQGIDSGSAYVYSKKRNKQLGSRGQTTCS